MCVGSLAGVTYLRNTGNTALASPKKGETAVRCCDPALSVLVMLVSRNVFHVVSALQSIVCLSTFFFWLIRSLVDPTLAAFIVCGLLEFLVSFNSKFPTTAIHEYPVLFIWEAPPPPSPPSLEVLARQSDRYAIHTETKYSESLLVSS